MLLVKLMLWLLPDAPGQAGLMLLLASWTGVGRNCYLVLMSSNVQSGVIGMGVPQLDGLQ